MEQTDVIVLIPESLPAVATEVFLTNREYIWNKATAAKKANMIHFVVKS